MEIGATKAVQDRLKTTVLFLICNSLLIKAFLSLDSINTSL
jgi:hypothetical protein